MPELDRIVLRDKVSERVFGSLSSVRCHVRVRVRDGVRVRRHMFDDPIVDDAGYYNSLGL